MKRLILTLSSMLTVGCASASQSHESQDTVPAVEVTPQAPPVCPVPEQPDPDLEALKAYATPVGPGADALEERAWAEAFHRFRETLIRQCTYGGCRFDMPEEYDFMRALKIRREYQRQHADGTP